jgi:hypothetical protein
MFRFFIVGFTAAVPWVVITSSCKLFYSHGPVAGRNEYLNLMLFLTATHGAVAVTAHGRNPERL